MKIVCCNGTVSAKVRVECTCSACGATAPSDMIAVSVSLAGSKLSELGADIERQVGNLPRTWFPVGWAQFAGGVLKCEKCI